MKASDGRGYERERGRAQEVTIETYTAYHQKKHSIWDRDVPLRFGGENGGRGVHNTKPVCEAGGVQTPNMLNCIDIVAPTFFTAMRKRHPMKSAKTINRMGASLDNASSPAMPPRCGLLGVRKNQPHTPGFWDSPLSQRICSEPRLRGFILHSRRRRHTVPHNLLHLPQRFYTLPCGTTTFLRTIRPLAFT